MSVVKCTGRGLVVKRPGVLSKVQMLNLVLGVGVFSLLLRNIEIDSGEQKEALGLGSFQNISSRGSVVSVFPRGSKCKKNQQPSS